MAEMYILASLNKKEEEKVIDEDLTYSTEEDAIKNMITSMKSSDEKIWNKYNDGEDVDIYLYQLDKEHHPCLYKKVEVEKDGDSYKVDDEESYDLPEDFEALSLDDDSKEKESEEDDEKEMEEACKLVDVFFDLYETGIITEESLSDELLILEEVVGRKSVADAAQKRKEETKKRKQWLKIHSRNMGGHPISAEEKEFLHSREWLHAWDEEDKAKRNYDRTVSKYNQQRAAAKERLKQAQKEKKEKEKQQKNHTSIALEFSMSQMISNLLESDIITESKEYELKAISLAANMISGYNFNDSHSMNESIALLSERADIELNECQYRLRNNIDTYISESISLVNQYITEKTLKSKDRNVLDDSEFGIPSLRKYPIPDKAHVKAAVQRFNFVDKAHEKELANNLIKALKKFNMLNEIKVGKGNRFKAYLDAEYKNFSESFDLNPFPNLTKEFSVGNMLPMMGNTRGWGSELSNTPIDDVVAAGNVDLEKYATLYDTSELINDSEVAMESVLPKRNMIFDKEVEKLLRGVKDYVSNPKNDFLEDILKKSINFKKNVYTIRLKEQNGSDSNKIINKIKSAGFKNVDDEGIKAVFEKEVNGLLLTLVYDTVSDKLRITYEHMNKGESVITEGFFNRFRKREILTRKDISEIKNIFDVEMKKNSLIRKYFDEYGPFVVGNERYVDDTMSPVFAYFNIKVNEKYMNDFLSKINKQINSYGAYLDYDCYPETDPNTGYVFLGLNGYKPISKVSDETYNNWIGFNESVNYDKYIEILNERHDEVLKQIKIANIPSGRRAKAKLILDDNFQKANRFFLKMQEDKGLFTKFVKFLDRKGAISKSKIANLFDDYLLLSDEEIYDIRRKEAEIDKINAEAYDARRRSAVQMEAIMTAGSVAKTAIAARTATTLIDESGKDIDDDIQSVVDILNKKGYKTVASCSGHTKTRIKEDVYKDGIYNNKLYTTARIIFADDFKLNPPKGWKTKNFDGKIGIYPVTPSYSYSKGMPDDAFEKWKADYMSELKLWANNLGEKPGPEETKTESMDDFMTSIFGESFKDSIGNAFKKPTGKKIKDGYINDFETNLTFEGVKIRISSAAMKDRDQLDKDILSELKKNISILNSNWNKILTEIINKFTEKHEKEDNGEEYYTKSKSDFKQKAKIDCVRYIPFSNEKGNGSFEIWFNDQKHNPKFLGGHALVVDVDVSDGKISKHRYSIEG